MNQDYQSIIMSHVSKRQPFEEIFNINASQNNSVLNMTNSITGIIFEIFFNKQLKSTLIQFEMLHNLNSNVYTNLFLKEFVELLEKNLDQPSIVMAQMLQMFFLIQAKYKFVLCTL